MNKKLSTLPDKWFLIPILLFSIILLYSLIQFSQIINYFPLHFLRDLAKHMAEIIFINDYGFSGTVPYWYNGYIPLKSYPPGWFYLALPFYYITKNIGITTFITLILTFLLTFLGINCIGKLEKISLTKRITFFLLFIGNALSITNLFIIGRLPEYLAWAIFILVFFLIMYYKDRSFNYYSLLFIPIISLLILTHIYIFILSLVLFLSLFLIKNNKQRGILILFVLFSIILTSFWWVSFLGVNNGEQSPYSIAFELKEGSSFISYNTIALLLFFIIFYFYWKSKDKSKQELLFYSPVLLLALLLITRILCFVPVYNNLPTSPYTVFFIFMSLFLFLKTRFNLKNLVLKNLIFYGLILISLLSILSLFLTQNFLSMEYNTLEKETIDLLPFVNNRFLVLSSIQEEYNPDAILAYASAYYKLSGPNGYYSIALSIELKNNLRNVNIDFTNKNCDLIIKDLKILDVKDVFTHDSNCLFLINKCNLKLHTQKSRVCLLNLPLK